jgi:hypothetical protein
MPAVPQVFISATSRDLGSFRKAVADVLLTLGAHPIIQEHFPPDHRSVLEMLRARIGPCDAVLCLVGRRYGYEPLTREANEPRRSYTQLEYEIARELGKPVFVFLATDDCALDPAADETEELRGLQLEHLKRIVASDHLRMMFHSLGHLTDQVRVMRFDPDSLAKGVTTRLAVLLFAELIDGEGVRERRGELAWVRDVVRPFHDLSRTRWRAGAARCGRRRPANSRSTSRLPMPRSTRPSPCTTRCAGTVGREWLPGSGWASMSGRSSSSAAWTSRASSRPATPWTSAAS